MNVKQIKICVLGMGYVGLPLALEFGKKIDTVGFDINLNRIKNLKKKIDKNKEYKKKDFSISKKISFSNSLKDIESCNFYIIAVPTPIDQKNNPDLSLLKKACINIGKVLKKNDTVVIESTVYPGVTEEVCLPILQKKSNLYEENIFNLGYSPERINPGDKKHNLKNVVKVISGKNSKSLKLIKKIYKVILKDKIYTAKSIKVAESAKVIENIQRDVNIALINEMAIIFNKLNIDTQEVLDTASTKWNFIRFNPGLVGGHCIGVDPYYLSYIAKKSGYKNKMILSGRSINNYMPQFIVKNFLKLLTKNNQNLKKKKVLVLGLTFKENCKDYRNTKVLDIVNLLQKKNIFTHVSDPLLKNNEIKVNSKINFKSYAKINLNDYHGIILAVAHNQFKNINLNNLRKKNIVIYDIKSFFKKELVDARL